MNEENNSAPSQGSWLTEFLDSGFSYSIHSSRLLSRSCSAYQDIEIHNCDTFGRVLRLDDAFMTSERDEFFYHENLIHVAACAHHNPVDALIIGGGDGGAAEELLKHSTIKNIFLVELDGQVIETARTYLRKIHQGVLDEPPPDPRLHVRVENGLDFVKKCTDQFDLIILDLTDSGGFSQPLYAPDFYRACAARLKQDGVLSLHIASPFTQPERMVDTLGNLKQAFAIVRPYLISIPLYGGLWMMASASHSVDTAKLPAAMADIRLQKRGVTRLRYYNGSTHQAAMAMPNFIRDTLAFSGLGVE